jgi:hypothetical protein
LTPVGECLAGDISSGLAVREVAVFNLNREAFRVCQEIFWKSSVGYKTTAAASYRPGKRVPFHLSINFPTFGASSIEKGYRTHH